MSAINEAPPIPPAAMERPAAKVLPLLAGIVLIGGAALLAYWPSLGGGFIWDDRLYLTHCDLIKAPDGLYRFWFTTDPIDYWPLSNSSLWLEWRLWGLQPAGYRVTNLVLHVAAALLIWAVLKQLAIPGAFLAALLFTVHPVNVESVAWIAQRKGLLAMLFLLLSVLWFLWAEEEQPGGEKITLESAGADRWYWLSLLAFVLAMLSKGSVAFLPVILLAILWWRRRRITAADLAATMPFFLVALVLTMVNIWFQAQHAGAGIRAASFIERLAGAGEAPWFYLSKALLPIDLAFVYPLWKVAPANLLWWLPLVAAAAVTALLLWHRDGRWRRTLLFGWIVFCVALTPVLGFTDVYFMKFSLAADHYQYHALVAVVALVAAGCETWRKAAQGVARIFALLLAVVVAGSLTALAAHQSGTYRDALTLWQATLQRNPECSVAHVNLGVMLADANMLPEAINHFQQALRINSTDAEAHHDLGTVCFKIGRIEEAIDHYQQALKFGGESFETESNLGLALALTGRFEEAIGPLEQAVKLKPAMVDTRFTLGLVLMNLGRLQEAIDQFKLGLESQPDSVKGHFNLALIYDKLNRRAEAEAAAQKALDFARQQGQTDMAQQIESWLRMFRERPSPGASEPNNSAPPAVPPSAKP